MKALSAAKTILAATPFASATTARTAAIDCQGADYALIAVPIGIEANTNSTNVVLEVLHSDDTVVTNHVSLGTTLIDNTAAVVASVRVNLIGKKRYLRVTATPDTTTNGAVLVGGVVATLMVEASPGSSTTAQLVTI